MNLSIDHFPVGLELDVSYPNFTASLSLLSTTQLKFEIKEGTLAHIEIVDIHVVPLGNSLFTVSWQEKDGATVTNVQDFDRGLIHSHATLRTASSCG
ncbi:hypothetical protein RLEG3_27880 [Rhizobium leguminosarum bv. trifolii WSM1689]|uniref:MoaF-related domain-containing protein n=1 Tax=Rhizobium leguminosarum TaxID=384 RepID=UPI0003E09E10|nr:hypothetical protein [Rhizobium leguminosarum]AHF85411.1 hypothetical protein RLEG3_27880 [Rhizobium leguminosarum bv. trifolii WSM1689]